MIAPQTTEEARYVHTLAAHMVHAHEQVAAGDRPGSRQFTAAYRDLARTGEDIYRERNRGLVEYADLLAAESPRSERLTRFLAEQTAAVASPPPAPEAAAPAKRARKGKE